jgi:hypothetical protein
MGSCWCAHMRFWLTHSPVVFRHSSRTTRVNLLPLGYSKRARRLLSTLLPAAEASFQGSCPYYTNLAHWTQASSTRAQLKSYTVRRCAPIGRVHFAALRSHAFSSTFLTPLNSLFLHSSPPNSFSSNLHIITGIVSTDLARQEAIVRKDRR